MRLKSVRLLIAIFVISLITTQPSKAAREIYWWHAMTGPLEQWVLDLALQFNNQQSDYVVVPVFKGNYSEVMNAAIASFRAHKNPHIVQVFEVGTATMMAAQGAVYPVYQLMEDTQTSLSEDDFLPAIKEYYATSEGRILSLPFNSSTPVLYYNKEAFQKAGLDVNTPPKTWEEIESFSQKLLAAGYKCGFTTAWQSWVLIENFSAWHNLPIGTKANGFDGLDTELLINSPEHVKHISKIAEWQKQNVFSYGGRKDEPMNKFSSQECAIFMSSSGAYAPVKDAVSFEFGVGQLPYWSSMVKEPQNSIIGGATLWILRNHEPEDYKGVAQFLAFLSQPEIQAQSHQRTGYLPVTKAAFELSKAQGYYEKNPYLEIPILQLNHATPTAHSKGLRFGNFLQIRDIIDEELESVWSGKKTAKEALDEAVKRGNAILRDFEKTHK